MSVPLCPRCRDPLGERPPGGWPPVVRCRTCGAALQPGPARPAPAAPAPVAANAKPAGADSPEVVVELDLEPLEDFPEVIAVDGESQPQATSEARRAGPHPRPVPLSPIEEVLQELSEEEGPDEGAVRPPGRKRRGERGKGPRRAGVRRGRNREEQPALLWPWLAVGGAGLVVCACLAVAVSVAGRLTTETATAPPPEEPAEPPPVAAKKPPPASTPASPRAPAAARLTVARLRTEYAADPSGTNARYGGRTLELGGTFDRLEPGPAPDRPAGFLFGGPGLSVRCGLSRVSTDRRWSGLPGKTPLTVRAVYRKDCSLIDGELLSLGASANPKYKGKEVEVVGRVGAVEGPAAGRVHFKLTLEADSTDALVDVAFLFRETDGARLVRMPQGTTVVVRGTCGGRPLPDPPPPPRVFPPRPVPEAAPQGPPVVRVHNCRLVPPTEAPRASVPRMPLRRFVREYDEDLRGVVPPADDSPPQWIGAAGELEAESRADPKGLAARLGNKVLVVRGRVEARDRGRGLLVLSSGDTDKPLRLHCFFTAADYGDLNDDAPEAVVRGVCTGPSGPDALRLDDCSRFDPQADPRRLGVEHLPHLPGRSLLYEVTVPEAKGPKARGVPTTVRLRVTDGEGGLREVATLLPDSRKPKKPGESVRFTPAGKAEQLHYRVRGGFVEVGRTAGAGGEAWEPVLKLGARAGVTWRWQGGDGTHAYTVSRFEDGPSGTRAVVLESVWPKESPNLSEVEHVYAEGVGEVERRVYRRVSAGREPAPVSEIRLLSDEEDTPAVR